MTRERAPQDDLDLRVARPKTRMPWATERLHALLTSPIYRGCVSPQRRWKPGPLVIRDATYWVPLMVATMGTRIEEVLGLKRRNLILRNGTHCLALGKGPDQSAKTSDSERIVPAPETLLRLGFVEWVGDASGAHALLFHCAADRASGATLSAAFGKQIGLVCAEPIWGFHRGVGGTAGRDDPTGAEPASPPGLAGPRRRGSRERGSPTVWFGASMARRAAPSGRRGRRQAFGGAEDR